MHFTVTLQDTLDMFIAHKNHCVPSCQNL